MSEPPEKRLEWIFRIYSYNSEDDMEEIFQEGEFEEILMAVV